jgi:hypothetical protein
MVIWNGILKIKPFSREELFSHENLDVSGCIFPRHHWWGWAGASPFSIELSKKGHGVHTLTRKTDGKLTVVYSCLNLLGIPGKHENAK